MPLDEYAVPLEAVSGRRPSRPHIATGAPDPTGMRPPHPSTNYRGELEASRTADLGYQSVDPRQPTLPPGAEPARRPGTAVPYSPPGGRYGQDGDSRSYDQYQAATTQASRHGHPSPDDNDHHGYDTSRRSDAHARALSRLDPASSTQGNINGIARGHDSQPTGARSQAYALHPGTKLSLDPNDIENNVTGSSHPSRATAKAPSNSLASSRSKATVGRTRSTDQGTTGNPLSANRSANDVRVQRSLRGNTTTSPTSSPQTRSNRTSTSSQSPASPVDGRGTARSPEYARAPGLRARKASAETGSASHFSPGERRAPQSPPAQASTSALGFQSRQNSLQAQQGVYHSPTSPVGSPIHAPQNASQVTASRLVAPATSVFEVAEHDDDQVPDLSPTELGSNASNPGSPQDATGTNGAAAGIDAEDAENGASGRRPVARKTRTAPSKILVHRAPLRTAGNRISMGPCPGSFKMPLEQLSAPPQETTSSSPRNEIQSPNDQAGKGKGKSASWTGDTSETNKPRLGPNDRSDPKNLTREELISLCYDLKDQVAGLRVRGDGDSGAQHMGPISEEGGAPVPLSPSESTPGIVDENDPEKGPTDPALRQKPWYHRLVDNICGWPAQIRGWPAAIYGYALDVGGAVKSSWGGFKAFLGDLFQWEVLRRVAPHFILFFITLGIAAGVTWGLGEEHDSRLISWAFVDTNLLSILKKAGKVVVELRKEDVEAKEEEDKQQGGGAAASSSGAAQTTSDHVHKDEKEEDKDRDKKKEEEEKEKRKKRREKNKKETHDIWVEWFEDLYSILPTVSTCISLRMVGVTLPNLYKATCSRPDTPAGS